jgi:hypothetical protein
MAASLRGRESGNRGTPTVGRCYQSVQWRLWLKTLVCVWQWFVKCSHELFNGPINSITNPNHAHSHSTTWQYQDYEESQNYEEHFWKACVLQVEVYLCTRGSIGSFNSETNLSHISCCKFLHILDSSRRIWPRPGKILHSGDLLHVFRLSDGGTERTRL